jgi:hypothetical protein
MIGLTARIEEGSVVPDALRDGGSYCSLRAARPASVIDIDQPPSDAGMARGHEAVADQASEHALSAPRAQDRFAKFFIFNYLV